MKELPSSPLALPVVRAAELKQTLPDTRWLIDSLRNGMVPNRG